MNIARCSSLILLICLLATCGHAGAHTEKNEDRPRSLRWKYASKISWAAAESTPGEESTPRSIAVKPPPNVWRALAEDGAFILISAANYWRKYASFIEDWQYELNWRDQQKRFLTLEAQRFDSNHFRLNWTHGLAGSIYYNFGRANHWTVGQAALLTVGTSLFWEAIAEWREIMSINDNIFTGLGGIVTGEVIFQSAQYLLGQKKWLIRALPVLFNPIAVGNRLLDSGRSYRFPIPDREYWFFDLGGNRTLADSQVSPASFWHLGMEHRLSFFQEALRGSQRVVRLPQVSFTQFAIQFRFAGDRVEDCGFLMRSGFSGWLRREGSPHDAAGQRPGFRWLGWGGVFRFYQRRPVAPYDSPHDYYRDDWEENVTLPTRFLDKWAILNPFGLQYVGNRSRPRSNFTIQFGFYPNFSLIHAAALNDYSRTHSLAESKTTLKNYGYYYGWGVSGEWDWRLVSGHWEASQELSLHYCRSIEGLDRFEPILDDFPLWDARLLGRWSVLFHPRRLPLAIGLQYEIVGRWGGIHPVRHSGGEGRLSYFLRYYW